MLAEVGHGLSLYMAGKTTEAMTTVDQWRSSPDADEWHYVVEIARAIIRGGAGRPGEATSALAEAVRRLRPASVWGRADDFQMAFGMLADFRGEHALAGELLATPFRGISCWPRWWWITFATTRGKTDDVGRGEVAMELWTRIFPDGVRRGTRPPLLNCCRGGPPASLDTQRRRGHWASTEPGWGVPGGCPRVACRVPGARSAALAAATGPTPPNERADGHGRLHQVRRRRWSSDRPRTPEHRPGADHPMPRRPSAVCGHGGRATSAPVARPAPLVVPTHTPPSLRRRCRRRQRAAGLPRSMART